MSSFSHPEVLTFTHKPFLSLINALESYYFCMSDYSYVVILMTAFTSEGVTSRPKAAVTMHEQTNHADRMSEGYF